MKGQTPWSILIIYLALGIFGLFKIATLFSISFSELDSFIYFENYTKPKIEATQTGKASWYEITGYCLKGTMASGKQVYDGAVACPSNLKLGTKVRLGLKEYTCEDRMAKKYRDGKYIDIWFSNCQDALNWGRRKVEVFIDK